MRWSLFCRVIDNHGDAGFCLRLARELVARGETVQLFIDDASALRWMQADARIEPLPWPGEAEQPALGEVLIEAFGCDLPDGVLRVAARDRPLWINLEYLSAESYVERSHGLPSPVLSGPAAGCVKRFCYPGFTARTGGLLRERGLQPAWQAHDAQAWWRCLTNARSACSPTRVRRLTNCCRRWPTHRRACWCAAACCCRASTRCLQGCVYKSCPGSVRRTTTACCGAAT